MITAVDTNVLVDVLTADPRYGERSRRALQRCLADGALVMCEVVWAETAAGFAQVERFPWAVQQLGMTLQPISERAATAAGSAWREYRRAGGARDRILPDFLIGAHARAHADRLLTRDRGFYRTFFGSLPIIDPAAS